MTQIAGMYGEALYSLAQSENLTEQILEELTALKAGFDENPEYARLLSTPNLPKIQRTQILDDGFAGKIHPYILNFLKILTEKGYISQFPGCCDAYRQHYNRDMGIVPVVAVTAVPLTELQSQRLNQKLAETTGKKIALTNRVDPNCLGGVRLDFDGKQLDDTVSHRLNTISKLLQGTVL